MCRTQGGLVNPAEAVGAVARRHGVTYLLGTPASRPAGQMPLDVQAIGCGLPLRHGPQVPCAGRAARGSCGCAGELVDRLEPPFVDLHSAEWTGPGQLSPEPGTRAGSKTGRSFVAGRIGLAAAARYALWLGLGRDRAPG